MTLPEEVEPSALKNRHGKTKTIPANQKVYNSLSSTTGFLKYPTGRDQSIKTSQRWMEGKRIDDGCGPYWRIHNKLYDLNQFINKHPGGRDWLLATKGSDITEVFESSHISSAAENLLPNFFVKDATTPRNSPFTFHQEGFYRKLKKKVRPILQNLGTGPTKSMLLIMDGLTASFIALALSATITQSVTLAVVAGMCLTLASYASHNFSHQRDNWRMYVMDLSLQSSYDWRISHALSHHPFPNTFYDLEINKLEPFFQMLPRPNKTWSQRYGCRIYEHIIAPTYLFLNAFRKYYLLLVGEEKFRPEYILPAVELLIMAILAQTFSTALKIWTIMHMSSSIMLAYMGLVLAHHHPDAYHEGDKARDDSDWGLHQLDATRDREEVTGNLFLVATTLGDHTLHHLLPTVDHSKLHHIYPVFYDMCKEYGIPFRFYTQWEMIKGKYLTLANNKPSELPPGYKKIE